MLKSFEYIDPLLAQKIKTLEKELERVERTKQEILGNGKLAPGTREKLMRYQNECSKNISRMLCEQKDKLVQYLDEQTNVVTKTNRTSASKAGKSHNITLNQSTRIDFSTVDDSKSLDLTTKTDLNRKVSSFYIPATTRANPNPKYPNKNLPRIKRMKKQLLSQKKLISMLVAWIKIYYERQQSYNDSNSSFFSVQNEALKQQNSKLQLKCHQLQEDLKTLRSDFKSKAASILETQRQYDHLRQQNEGLKLQRRQLLLSSRSPKKNASRS